jgi:hypothetical protein
MVTRRRLPVPPVAQPLRHCVSAPHTSPEAPKLAEPRPWPLRSQAPRRISVWRRQGAASTGLAAAVGCGGGALGTVHRACAAHKPPTRFPDESATWRTCGSASTARGNRPTGPSDSKPFPDGPESSSSTASRTPWNTRVGRARAAGPRHPVRRYCLLSRPQQRWSRRSSPHPRPSWRSVRLRCALRPSAAARPTRPHASTPAGQFRDHTVPSALPRVVAVRRRLSA